MSKFNRYEFNEEIISKFKERREIPVHFYNKDGQILIYKKENATEKEIERILRFVEQGIYYNIEDSEALGIAEKRDLLEGLSDVKLLTAQHAEELAHDTSELFNQLKAGSINSYQASKSKEKMEQLFNDFENQPDAMIGLVNIIELMQQGDSPQDVSRAVKRTVTAMAMKTRGMQAQSFREQKRMSEMVSVLMMGSLLCDIGCQKMNMPESAGLSAEEMNYVKNHPMMSYLMLAHEPGIDKRVKNNILCHHRPMRQGKLGNNYPDYKCLINRLETLQEKYRGDSSKSILVNDIAEQLKMLKTDEPYHEDANIIAIASEFASLTTEAFWRGAFTPQRAVRMIINNSYFTYSGRIIREFLDHTAISLCDNQKILSEGDFIIVAARTRDERTFFEVCRISSIGRYQSRPGVDRIATILPEIEKSPKLTFKGFNLDNVKPDPRKAHYELSQDDTRRIVYAVDPACDEILFPGLMELARKTGK